ncbi:MAG: glycosyltransferase [Acetobacteraceae bacterium]|nr:glycosyltransferase [Acetobacteraceae bacterium]
MQLSVAMATRNADRFVAEAIASVHAAAAAANVSCEILLADGSSEDDTVAIASALPRVRVVSREDGGLYDGMNRALDAALGEHVMIVNADDLLLEESLGPALAALAGAPDRGFLSGDMLFGSSRADAAAAHNQRPLSVEGAFWGIPAINARLFRRDFLNRIGRFRTDLGLGADRDLLARIADTGGPGVHFALPLYFYRVHQGSSTIAGDRDARLRVYRADMQMAAAYLAEPDGDLEFIAHARAKSAVAALKARILGSRREPHCRTVLADLAGGAVLSRRWRGRMAGY